MPHLEGRQRGSARRQFETVQTADARRIAVLASVSMRPLDTTDEAWAVQIEIYRNMPPAERLRIGLELSATSRRLLRDGIRQRHPEYTDPEVEIATIRALLPRELFRAAYPGIPELAP